MSAGGNVGALAIANDNGSGGEMHQQLWRKERLMEKETSTTRVSACAR